MVSDYDVYSHHPRFTLITFNTGREGHLESTSFTSTHHRSPSSSHRQPCLFDTAFLTSRSTEVVTIYIYTTFHVFREFLFAPNSFVLCSSSLVPDGNHYSFSKQMLSIDDFISRETASEGDKPIHSRVSQVPPFRGTYFFSGFN